MQQIDRTRFVSHRAAILIAAGALSLTLAPGIALADTGSADGQPGAAQEQISDQASGKAAGSAASVGVDAEGIESTSPGASNAEGANGAVDATNTEGASTAAGTAKDQSATGETATPEKASTSPLGESATAPIANGVAKIGETEYDSLDKAIDEAKDGESIDLQGDCELTVGTISKPITINGNGFTITVAKKINENNALSLHSSLTFNNTIVNFSAPADWNLVMSSNGVLNLNAGSKCNFTVSGIYASPNATINVDASSLGFEGTGYTAMMAEKYGNLNLKNGASLSIKHASNGKGGANGITSFKINATGSTLDVSENENQGLVRCWLTLDNSTATVSGNETGMTCYNKTDALTVKNGSKLIMENNKNAGIFMWGGKIDVQDGNTLVVSGTGYGASASDYSPYCGAVVSYYYNNTYAGSITFADGATVNIINNPFGGLRNYATTYLGSGTSIENNGYSGNDIKTPYGGGIWNCGQLTLSPNAKVCNNHALHAGDDIYNTTGTTDEKVKGEYAGTYTGSISFNAVGNNWQLDDCNHAITGWFDDSEASGDNDSSNNAGRWNAHGENKHVVEYSGFGKEAVSDQLSLKAAHGLASVKYQWVSTDNPTDVLAPTGDSDLEVGAGYTAKAQDPSEGWTFDGWYTDESCTIKWNDGDALAGSMTLFGKWTQDPKADPSPAPETSQPGNQPTVTKAAESQQAATPEHLAKTGDALLPFGFAVAGIALIAGAIALISRKLLKR